MSHRALGPQFHATYIQGWAPHELPADEVVHVGTRAAAQDRLGGAHHAMHTAEYPDEVLARADFSRPHVHEVELTGAMHPHTLEDGQYGIEHTLHKVMAAHPEHDVFAYTNEHEDPGSVSYAARPRAVRVRRSEQVTPPR